MKLQFAHQVSNVMALLAGFTRVKHRGAQEASILLVTGQPGLGKTEAMRWFVTQEKHAVYIRAKSGWTRHWFLSDLLVELGYAPQRLTEDMFKQAKEALALRQPTLVIDEVEHALMDHRVLEAIRDLVDLLCIPVVLVGMGEVRAKLIKHPQIWSRIATVVEFGPITLDDVHAAAKTLLDGVVLQPDLLAELHRQCDGRMRLLLNGLRTCERMTETAKVRSLALADVEGKELIHDWTSKKPGTVSNLRVQK